MGLGGEGGAEGTRGPALGIKQGWLKGAQLQGEKEGGGGQARLWS